MYKSKVKRVDHSSEEGASGQKRSFGKNQEREQSGGKCELKEEEKGSEKSGSQQKMVDPPSRRDPIKGRTGQRQQGGSEMIEKKKSRDKGESNWRRRFGGSKGREGDESQEDNADLFPGKPRGEGILFREWSCPHRENHFCREKEDGGKNPPAQKKKKGEKDEESPFAGGGDPFWEKKVRVYGGTILLKPPMKKRRAWGIRES